MKPSLVVIGLGNPGKAYEKTRHNTGFKAVELLADTFGTGEWEQKQKFKSDVMEGRIVTVPVLFVKPQTFMNDSGEAVKKIVDFYKLNPKEQILIINDELDLPLGETRLKKKGGPGTHNGLKSITLAYGEEYPRLRIGIHTERPAGMDLANWVLSAFEPNEENLLAATLEGIPEIVKTYVMETTHDTAAE